MLSIESPPVMKTINDYSIHRNTELLFKELKSLCYDDYGSYYFTYLNVLLKILL